MMGFGMHLRPVICNFQSKKAIGCRGARIQRGRFLFVCKAVHGEAFPAGWLAWPYLRCGRGALIGVEWLN